MANKKASGEKKPRAPRKAAHYVVEHADGTCGRLMDKAALAEYLPEAAGDFAAVYKVIPVFVRRVEVIKFGKPRTPRADAAEKPARA